MGFELPAPDLSIYRKGNTSVEGVWNFDSGHDGRHVLITALVHGNEMCGAWALKGLLDAEMRPQKGQLTLAFCNLAAFDIFDPDNHDASRFVEQDLNRQWTPDRILNADTLERRRAAELAPFIEKADWLLDLHSMHEISPPLTLTGMSSENVQLAKQMGTPIHIVVDGGHKDGKRMRDFGRYGDESAITSGVRSLLVECGFHGDFSSQTVAQDQCVRFLTLAGVIDRNTADAMLPNWRMPDSPHQWVLDVTDAVVAKTANVKFTDNFKGLEVISKAGTIIGYDDGPIITPYNDCVLIMPSLKQARPGVTVVRFARRRLR